MLKIVSKTVIFATIAVLAGIGVASITNKTPEKQVVELSDVPYVYEQNTPQPTKQPVKRKLVRLNPDPEQLVVLNTPVVYETVQATIARLEQLKSDGHKEAYIILDSPGGSVFDGTKLLSWMKHSPLKVNTICDGICASMAAHLFEGGKVRYMTDKSTLMFHPASGGLKGTLEEMFSRLTYVIEYVNRLDAEVATRAGIPIDDFKKKTLVEYWVETDNAISVGLADNLAFISYSRSNKSLFNMEEHLKEQGIAIPRELLIPGFVTVDSIRLKKD